VGFCFFMQYADALRYLYSLGNEVLAAKLGLHNISTLLESVGNPHRRYDSVLIAGTNGKGSVAAFIESVLRKCGLNTGLYTSPHLMRIEERVRVRGNLIAAEDFARLTQQVKDRVGELFDPLAPSHTPGRLDRHPTYFEMVTAIGFCSFAERGVDVAVLEVGLGGRLDATNVVDPCVAVITNVDYDHQKYLGSRLEEIAAEKAGIIKRRADAEAGPLSVVCTSDNPVVRTIVEEHCRAAGARCLHPHDEAIVVKEPDALGRFRLKVGFPGLPALDLRLPLPGEHQVRNAIAAIRAVMVLQAEGFPIDASDIQEGMEAARWPGRLEVVSGDPPIILDGAHNTAGAEALRNYCERFLAAKRVVLLFGVMRDKDVVEIAGKLFPLASEIVLTAAESERSAEPAWIAAQLPEYRQRYHCTRSPQEALALARSLASPDGIILAAGSLFLVGDLQRALNLEAAA
jgi:dihydrofolate synthase/folylpolyglutamate synthase